MCTVKSSTTTRNNKSLSTLLINNDPVLLEMLYRKAKASFYTYCALTVPEVYVTRKAILKPLCNLLQKAYEDRSKQHVKVLINLPPRTGKSLTFSLFTAWTIGIDINTSIIRATYSQLLSDELNTVSRDAITSRLHKHIFNVHNLMIDTNNKRRFKYADSKRANLLATSVGGTSTGYGAGIIILDDPFSSWMEASSTAITSTVRSWYETALITRLDTRYRLEVQGSTRWSVKEFVHEQHKAGYFDYEYILPALTPDGNSFCEDVISTAQLLEYKKLLPSIKFDSIYQQTPSSTSNNAIDEFTYYEGKQGTHKNNLQGTFIVIDTKSTGRDYFVVAVFGITNKGDVIVLDMFFTNAILDDSLEVEIIDFINKQDADVVHVEVNHSPDLVRYLKRHVTTKVRGFRTTKNKQLKILNELHNIRQYKIINTNNEQYNNAIEQALLYDLNAKTQQHDDVIDTFAMFSILYKSKGGT